MIKKSSFFLCLFSFLMFFGCKISGTISENGAPLEGVTVSLNGLIQQTTTSNNKGEYAFNYLFTGTYTVTPMLDSYIFDPDKWELNIGINGMTNIDFDVVYGPSGPKKCVVGPYLQTATPTSIRIMWETAGPGESWIEWGTSLPLAHITNTDDDIESKELSIVDEFKYTFSKRYPDSIIHHSELTHLSPDTIYYYRITTREGSISDLHSFRTPPLETSDKSFTFIVYADNQRSPSQHTQIIDTMIEHMQSEIVPGTEIFDTLAMVWNVGDSVEDGPNYDGFKDEYFDPIQNLSSQVPFYSSIGNHEYLHFEEIPLIYNYKEKNGEIYFAYRNLPGDEHKYSFNYGNCHFIALDSNGPPEDECSFGGGFESQLEWLEEDLIEAGANPDIDFIFAFHHQPYKTELWNQFYGGCTQRVGEFIKLYEQYGVNAFFHGHTHAMERGNSKEAPVYWIDTSGGGSPLTHWLGPDTAETVSFDWPEIQKAIDEHGFHVVTITPGDTPEFNIEFISLGDLYDENDEDTVVADQITFKMTNAKPNKPYILYPMNTDNPALVEIIFRASPFFDTDIDDYHHETQWQITTVSGEYPPVPEPAFLWPPYLSPPDSPIIADKWIRFENIYGETPTGIPINTLEGNDLTEITIDLLSNPLSLLNTTFYWRVRYRDGMGLEWSEWSDEAMFSVVP